VGRFAQDTSVSVGKSKAEIEDLVTRYGADQFGTAWQDGEAVIGFRVKGRFVKFVLPLPDQKDKRFWESPTKRKRYDQETALKNWEQGCRQAWRALALVVKAKLEAVESGITTFDAEFLAHFVMPDGRIFKDVALPAIAEAYRTGGQPKMLLLGSGGSEVGVVDVDFRESGRA